MLTTILFRKVGLIATDKRASNYYAPPGLPARSPPPKRKVEDTDERDGKPVRCNKARVLIPRRGRRGVSEFKSRALYTCIYCAVKRRAGPLIARVRRRGSEARSTIRRALAPAFRAALAAVKYPNQAIGYLLRNIRATGALR